MMCKVGCTNAAMRPWERGGMGGGGGRGGEGRDAKAVDQSQGQCWLLLVRQHCCPSAIVSTLWVA